MPNNSVGTALVLAKNKEKSVIKEIYATDHKNTENKEKLVSEEITDNTNTAEKLRKYNSLKLQKIMKS